MNKPYAIWSSQLIIFDKDISTIQNVVLTQGSSALKATINRIDKLQELINKSPIDNAFIDSDIASTVSDICAQAGVAATILFNDSKKGRLESDVSYEFRKERLAYVRRFCDQRRFEPSILTDRRVRNSLTHIDEKLPDILSSRPSVGWFIDVAVRSRNEFCAPLGISIDYCRSYISDENRILHLGNELDLKLLRHECVSLLAIIFGLDCKISA